MYLCAAFLASIATFGSRLVCCGGINGSGVVGGAGSLRQPWHSLLLEEVLFYPHEYI